MSELRLNDSLFLRACRRERTERTPVWLMRQAGRYMPEYRAVRSRVSMLELCKDPDLVAEVTVTAAERLAVDAAIVFADILLIVEPLGLKLSYEQGEGPVIHNPLRTSEAIEALPDIGPDSMSYLFDAVTRTRAALDPATPLIGFCGAPFTLAVYMIEGGKPTHFELTKTLMHEEPRSWHLLLSKLGHLSAAFLRAQIDAGAQAVQVFDSWAGALSPADYREYVQPHTKLLFDELGTAAPTLHFGTATGALL